MWRANSWTVRNWLHIDVRDYSRLLRLGHDFVVSELAVHAGDWLADRTLVDAELSREGVLVLGIERGDGTYVGAPRGHTRIYAGDCLILYARQEALTDLDERSADIVGNMKHVIAVTRQLDELDREEAPDKGSPKDFGADWSSER